MTRASSTLIAAAVLAVTACGDTTGDRDADVGAYDVGDVTQDTYAPMDTTPTVDDTRPQEPTTVPSVLHVTWSFSCPADASIQYRGNRGMSFYVPCSDGASDIYFDSFDICPYFPAPRLEGELEMYGPGSAILGVTTEERTLPICGHGATEYTMDFDVLHRFD